MGSKKKIYRFVHPATGAVTFEEKGGRDVLYATFIDFGEGFTHAGWSSQEDFAKAARAARGTNPYGKAYTAAAATVVTAQERDAELAEPAPAAEDETTDEDEATGRWFDTYSSGDDALAAFALARVDQTEPDGGIRSKDRVVVLGEEALSIKDAYWLVDSLTEQNAQRVAEINGPCGAVPVRGGLRLVPVAVSAHAPGFSTVEEAARYSLAKQGLIRDGERIEQGIDGTWERDAQGRVTGGDLVVPVTGGTGPERTGWLFFGRAAR